jgi:hypothetical protein
VADGFSYEGFFTADEVAVFRMVKRGQMMLAAIVREELAELVGGTLGPGKDFLHTGVGVFRVALRHNSDNTTERGLHDRLHVETVNVGDPVELELFLMRHGCPSWDADTLRRRVGDRMREQAELLEPA